MGNGQKFRTIRSELRLTQKQMGIMLGVKQANYSGIENDKVQGISSRVFTALFFNLNVNPLFIQKGEMPVFMHDKPLFSQRIRKEMDSNNLTTAQLTLTLDPVLIRQFSKIMDNMLLPSREILEKIFIDHVVDIEYVLTAKRMDDVTNLKSTMATDKHSNSKHRTEIKDFNNVQELKLLISTLQESNIYIRELISIYKQQIIELKYQLKNAKRNQH